jgi:large subunit ribosomal protein L24
MPRTNNKQVKLHVKKGDTVILNKSITSAKELDADKPKGHTARVLQVFPDRQRVIVEGVNIRFRHTKPNQEYPQGARVQREMPIHASNVQPIGSDGKAVRIGRKRIQDANTGKGEWVRYNPKTGEEIK